MTQSRRTRLPVIVMLAGLLAFTLTTACDDDLGPDPEVQTFVLVFPGFDSVYVDLVSGVIASGPITMFGDADFTADFLTPDGSPDGRVVEGSYRLDVNIADTTITRFSRIGAFTGTFLKVTNGSTDATFSLVRESDLQVIFATQIPVDVN